MFEISKHCFNSHRNLFFSGELASVAQGLGAVAIRDLKSVGVRLGKIVFFFEITILIYSFFHFSFSVLHKRFRGYGFSSGRQIK